MSDERLTYPEWIRTKIQGVTEGYQKGEGYGDIFESQYLCYLECLVASRGFDPTGMWDGWRERIKVVAKLKKKDPVLAMNRYIEGDQGKLIAELDAFKTKWTDGPSPRKFVVKTEKLVAPQVKKADPEESGPPKLDLGRPGTKKKTKKAAPPKDDSIFDLFGGNS